MQRRTPTDIGCVHHIAFNVSRAVFMQAIERLDARGIKHTGVRDRKIFDAIYFEDPLGLLIELSCYKFEPPFGYSHADVLFEAHKLRVAAGDRAIAEVHLADAIELLVARSRAQPVGRSDAQESLCALNGAPAEGNHTSYGHRQDDGRNECLRSSCMC